MILRDAAGRILILRRRAHRYGDGGWCLPGGKVDYGATIIDTVKRELAEETGLRCESARFLFYQDSLPAEPGTMHCINFCFECTYSGEVRLNEESSEFAWIERGDLPRYPLVFRHDEALLRYWESK